MVRSLIMSTRAPLRFSDNTRVWSFTNGGCLIKKRGVFRAKHTQGTLIRAVRRKRYRAMFDEII